MEKAVRVDPEFFDAYRVLRNLYAKKGWKEKSQEADKKYLKYGPPRQYLPGDKKI